MLGTLANVAMTLFMMNPFRSIRKPSWKRFVGLVVGWNMSMLVALFAFSCYKANGGYATVFRQFVEYLLPILSICVILGAVLGGIHYVLVRTLGKQAEQTFRLRELGGVLLLMMILAAYPGIVIQRMWVKSKIGQALWQSGLEQEIERLVEKGNVHSAVQRMEQACQQFQEAKEKLGPDFEKVHRPGGGHSGNGYFCCTLGMAWDTLDLNMPRTLCWYFDTGPHYDGTKGHLLEDPEKWAPLGREMSASKTPILRVLGYHLLEDRERFAVAVYQQYDAGDPTFQALYALVQFSMDPDPRRATNRLGRSTDAEPSKGKLDNLTTRDRDGRVFQLTRQRLEEGQELGDDVETIRAAARRFVQTAYFEKSNFMNWDVKGSAIYKELDSLVSSGDVRAAVRRMEEACANHRAAVETLGEDFEKFNKNGDTIGFQNLNATLYSASDTLKLTIPRVIYYYLDQRTSYSGNYFQRNWPSINDDTGWNYDFSLNESGNLAPLAREMVESNTPILRVFGYWLLKDRDRFIETVYKEFDLGDRSFQSLDSYVEMWIDTNHRRALHRLVFHGTSVSGVLEEAPSLNRYYDKMLFRLACEILHEGHELGEDLPTVREATRRYVNSAQFKSDYPTEGGRKSLEKQLLQLGVEVPSGQ